MMLPHLEGARAAGFTVDVACNITRHGDDVRAHADALFDLPFRRSPISPSNLAALNQLTALLRERRYDIVHAHTPSGGIIGRIAATRAGIGVRVYTAHGFHFHKHGHPLSNLIYRTIETVAGHRWSDGVIVINQEDYDTALAQKVVSADRLFLTHGVGVSVDQFSPERVSAAERAALRAELGVDENTVVLTFVGEMIPRKRHADALRAFTSLHRTHPNTILALAGDGKLLDQTQELARTLGIAASVRFLGFRRDIPVLLAATDIFVFPSAQEGLPCSIQEAMCLEIPVVCSAVRGNVDMVEASCGRLAPLGDTEAMANALREVIEMGPEARREMGKAGRAKMAREYSRPRCVQEWLDVYRRLLERAGQTMPLPRNASVSPAQAAQ